MTLLLVLAGTALGQQNPPPRQATPQRTVPTVDQEKEKDDLPMSSPIKLLKYQHEEVKKDMDKLVKLVAEVQEEVDKAGENVLPLATLKKLDEVEKLTRKIRTRIRQ